ncbi:MAG: serine hydrolase [Pseudanabaenales cyanobacterium]|nr:serine hydrolase [Pseudanabaenales cyanobacterium]
MKLLWLFLFFVPLLLLGIFISSHLGVEKNVQFFPFSSSEGHKEYKAITPKSALEKLFVTKKIQTDWFTPTFLKEVPLRQLETIITNFKTKEGKFIYIKEIREEGKQYQVILEKSIIPTRIILDENRQITELYFDNPVTNFKGIDEAVSKFTSLSGEVGLLVLEKNNQLVAVNSTKPLAVGSTFKLAVLKALREKISSEKEYSWGDIVELKLHFKSLPTGILQDWPERSILTIESLASLMISQSDNTATDTLIHWIGKEKIEALTLELNHPFLTTREFFIIKNNQEILKRYRDANKEQKKSILAEIKHYPLPDVEAIKEQPVALDVEWFFSTQELCSLIEETHDIPLMKINSGVADKDDWEQVSFKGGSEPGVLNLTTWLQAKNGKTYCVSATWNNVNELLDEPYFFSLYSGILELLM